jgi:hypothetical protein
MSQKSQKRGWQPAPLTFWSSSQKRPADSIHESAKQGLLRKQVELRKHPLALADHFIMLRKLGLSLQEIADSVGATRLAVFRCLLGALSHNERLELGIST